LSGFAPVDDEFDRGYLAAGMAGIALGVFFIYLAGIFPQTFW
jgi:hypothetical protein